MYRRLILIEFNELTPTLIERFMREGDLPQFQAFAQSSTRYTTDAGDDPLEPWIQWPTVHCGVGYNEHRALHLGDGRMIPYKGIATVLSEAGYRVGVLGMMNGNYENLNGYYIPDPWDQCSRVSPRSLCAYYDFVAKQVQENTRQTRTAIAELIQFTWCMLRHGLSRASVQAVLGQLISERLEPGLRWRRACVLDLVQYDLFKFLNARHDVAFASFFSNSTAHLQHYFWRDMDDRGFTVPASADAEPSWRNAIRFGYRAMDRLLGRIVADNPGAILVLCSGLSQRPWYETTKCTYRPRDFGALLRFSGTRLALRVRPVMAERFRVECADATVAARVASALRSLRCRGQAIMNVHIEGRTVHTGCNLYDADPNLSEETVLAETREHRHFGDLFYQITAMNSGQHDPKGMLWIRNGRSQTVEGHLPLTAVAPLILRQFDVTAPETMRTIVTTGVG